WVLLHELGHVRRRDPLVLTIAVFVRAVHWFNPLAWLTVSRLRACMELSADEIVVRHVPEHSVADYGRILVHFASVGLQNRGAAVMGLIFMSADQSLKKTNCDARSSSPPFPLAAICGCFDCACGCCHGTDRSTGR
ncbi:MAG: M56 family metallopeptidase, partial [Planctomycetaceae bacterium]|nr:M56 family metallopeptidase [Planctomycetaceae bacterium]